MMKQRILLSIFYLLLLQTKNQAQLRQPSYFAQLNYGGSWTSSPVSGSGPLHILLENDFSGLVKIEILSLDGRVLNTFFTEKTSRKLTLSHPAATAPASFFVRVTHGKAATTRLVLRL